MSFKTNQKKRLFEALLDKHKELFRGGEIEERTHDSENDEPAFLRPSEPFEDEVEEIPHYADGGEISDPRKEVEKSFKDALGFRKPVDPQQDKRPKEEYGDVPNEEFLKALKKKRGY